MKTTHHLLTSSLAVLLTSSVFVCAQEKSALIQPGPTTPASDEWQFAFTPYLWLPSANVDFSVPSLTVGPRTLGGDFSVDQPWWDTISDFSSDFYVLSLSGRFEAWKGDWGGFVDGYWIFGKSTANNSDSALVLRDKVAITTSSSVTSRFGTGQLNFGPQYLLGSLPLNDTSDVDFILYGGGRVNWLSNEIDGRLDIAASAKPGAVKSQLNFSGDESRAFIEPMVGLKTIWKFGDSMVGTLRGDVGGFGAVENDNWDCDLEASIGWEVGTGVLLSLGYRARGQWEDAGSGGDITAEGWFYGPEIGVTWRF